MLSAILQVIAKQLFDVLRAKHGTGFDSFIREKVIPVAGDITLQNLGIEDTLLREALWKEIDIVVNVAATTGFYERYPFSPKERNKNKNKCYFSWVMQFFGLPCRYDVALNINVLGAKHVLEFAMKCVKIEMLLHVSTGEQVTEL